ncbi:hypothetical protein FRC17_001664 [Serendipita sp. 399]|nr:hypothetical protein FRC17_001664 [Serendipita sp. 399]
MATQKSAISRAPIEVWWSIVEYVLGTGHFFACTYDGAGDWSSVAEDCSQIGGWWLECERRKRQIGLLRMVCKPWKQFLDSVAPQFVMVDPSSRRQTLPTVDEIVRAERIIVMKDINVVLPTLLTRKLVQWKILQATLNDLDQLSAELEKSVYPHLCRLDLTSIHGRGYSDYQGEFNPYRLVDSLARFTNIVWLSYRTFAQGFPGCEEDDGGKKITLPRLQVLQYRGEGGFHLPYHRLNLPSLRHLAIYAQFNPNSLPLWQTMAALYGKTLQSLYIRAILNASTFKPDNCPYLPDWNEVPHLRELALDAPLCLRFHPLPATHPLRIFAGEIWMAERLLDWLNSESLELIRMISASREPDGSLTCTEKARFGLWSLPDISSLDMKLIEEKAASRGIAIRLCKEPSGRV